MDIRELVTRAEAKAGSLNKAEKALNIAAGALSRYRSGERPNPEPEIAALLAEYVGADPAEAVFEAVKQRAKTEKGRALILEMIRKHTASAKHAWGTLVLAALLGGQTAEAAAFNKTTFAAQGIHIVALRGRILARLFRRLHAAARTVLPPAQWRAEAC